VGNSEVKETVMASGGADVASGLSSGVDQTLDGRPVPGLYKHLFKTLCSSGEERVGCQLFAFVMSKSGLSKVQLQDVWEKADTRTIGSLNREDFYRALALIALIQQEQEATLESLKEWPEIPLPEMGDISDLEGLPADFAAIVMDYTYRELEDIDFVQITVAEKKGGAIKKHTNYSVYSRKANKTVTRRYNDFNALDMLLRKKYPYRVIPSLPAKGGMLSMAAMKTPPPGFIEERRKHLHRYMTCIAKHPTLRHDELVVLFLNESSSGDITKKLTAGAKASDPEWMSSSIAENPLAYLPENAMSEIESILTQVNPLLEKFLALDALIERTRLRRAQEARDWRELQASMLGLGQTGGGHVAGMENWETLQTAFTSVGQHLTVLVDRTEEQHMREADGLCMRLRCFTDMLTAFKEVIDRRMQTLKDLAMLKTKINKTGATLEKAKVKSADSQFTGKLEAKMVRRMSSEVRMQTESEFSIYCIWVESRLVRTQFAQVGTMIEELCTSQLTGMRQLSDAWSQLLPTATKLVTKLDIFTPYPKFSGEGEAGGGQFRARLFT